MPVSRGDLRPGDIILTKSQGTTTQRVIRLGEVLTPTLGGSSIYVHAQIVVVSGGTNMVAESHQPPQGPHLTIGVPDSPGTVFRLKNNGSWQDLPSLAAGEAKALCMEADASPGFAAYNKGKATYSLLRTADLDAKGQQLIQDVAEGRDVGGFFCSMFVVVCYQVAARKLMPPPALPISANADALSPAALDGYFSRHTTDWDNLGDYDPA